MANHVSAQKRARQTVVKTARNRVHESSARTEVKKVRAAIAENKKADAKAALISAQSQLHKLAKRKIVTKSNAARRISRLAKQIAALG